MAAADKALQITTGGRVQRIGDSSILDVGAGIRSSTGNLTLRSAAASSAVVTVTSSRFGVNASSPAGTVDIDNLTASESGLIVRDNGTQSFAVADGGNVAVGTLSTYPLTVTRGSGTAYVFAGNAATGYAGFILGNSSGTSHWALYQQVGAAGAQGNWGLNDSIAAKDRWTITPTTSAIGAAFVVNAASGLTGAGDNFDFKVKTQNFEFGIFVDASTDRVGIRNGSPGATLDVDNRTVAESAFIVRDNGTAKFTIGDGGNWTLADAVTIAVGSTTGTKIGTATTQKIGFFNATPVVQPSGVADATGGANVDAEARTAINTLISRLESLGLIATV